MPITIEMPKLSDTMTEGTLVKWIKKIGDTVAVGDILAEVETDKATMEMEAFDEGVLSEIYVKDGEKVQIGQKLAVLLGKGEKPGAVTPSPAAPAPAPELATPAVKQPAKDGAPGAAETRAEKDQTAVPSIEAQPGDRVKASPLAKKLAADSGVDLGRVQGSGPGGRIVRADVEAAAQVTQKISVTRPPTPKPQPVAVALEDKRI